MRVPKTIVTVQFSAGKIVLNTPKTKHEVRSLMKGDDNGMVTIPSLDEGLVSDQRTKTPIFMVTNEEITFNIKDILYYGIAETIDPPKITPVSMGIIMPDERRI